MVSEAPCRVNELGITMCFAQHDERLTNPRPLRECNPNKWVKLRSSMS